MISLNRDSLDSMGRTFTKQSLLKTINIIQGWSGTDERTDVVGKRKFVLRCWCQLLKAQRSIYLFKLGYTIPWPQRCKIWKSSTLFARDFTTYESRTCFGGLCRPPLAPNTKSWPNELMRRETFSEQDCNPGNLVLPVSGVKKNSLRSSATVTAFSVGSQGCGSHDAFISWDWIVSQGGGRSLKFEIW